MNRSLAIGRLRVAGWAMDLIEEYAKADGVELVALDPENERDLSDQDRDELSRGPYTAGDR